MLINIINRYWQLTTFRESPENTAYSPLLMVLFAVIFSILIVFQWHLIEIKPPVSVITSIYIAISLVLSYWIYSYALLKALGLTSRIVQTLTCLWASHVIIHLLAIPLLVTTPYLVKADINNPLVLFLGIVYFFISVGLSIWQFLITAHIYRLSLNISSLQSLLASLGLLAINILTVSLWR